MPTALHDAFLKITSLLTGKKGLEILRQNLKISSAERFFSKVIVMSPEKAMSLFSEEIKTEIDTKRYMNTISALFNKRKGEDELNKILYVDMKTTLVDEMLTKCDRMTMINGIEGRVPFLDHRLIELAFNIPGSYKRANGVGKVILRKLLAEELGEELAYRVKTGFNSPLKQWLSKDVKTKSFVTGAIANVQQLPFLNKAKLEEMVYDLGKSEPSSVLALVCLNQFLNESTDTNA